jgi:hypothetical protein
MSLSQTDIGLALNLSDLQIRILVWSYVMTAAVEQSLGWLFIWGIKWEFSQDDIHGEYSDQAVSRALRRLESRGLLVRSNHLRGQIRSSASDPPPTRTTAIKLTPVGRDVAQLITKCVSASS